MHEFSGRGDVSVTTKVYSKINWNEDFDYQDAKIHETFIKEDGYEDEDSEFDIYYCSECGKK